VPGSASSAVGAPCHTNTAGSTTSTIWVAGPSRAGINIHTALCLVLEVAGGLLTAAGAAGYAVGGWVGQVCAYGGAGSTILTGE